MIGERVIRRVTGRLAGRVAPSITKTLYYENMEVVDSIFCKNEDRQPRSGSCVLSACHLSIARVEGVHDSIVCKNKDRQPRSGPVHNDARRISQVALLITKGNNQVRVSGVFSSGATSN
jgi:hypothetical protein